MPVTTPQGRVFIGIDPTRAGRFAWFPTGDAPRRETREQREQFAKARRAQREYATRLRRIAQHIDDLVRGMYDPQNPDSIADIEQALEDYAELLGPWANSMAANMLNDVLRRDAAAWTRHGKRIGRALRQEIEGAPIGPAFQQLQAAQVELIKSLPLEAARRVHWLSQEALVGGGRAPDLAADIMAQGNITRSRANLIARTEAGRASTSFTQVRSQHLGSHGYIWRTSLDADVRPAHKRLEGTFHRWDAAPIASEPGQTEMRYHPGQGPNCRCFPEVVLPDEDVGAMAQPAERSLAYLEAVEASGGPTSSAVAMARHREPRLAQRLAEARQEVAELQRDIHMAARRGDQEAVAEIDVRLQTARRRYDDLGAQFDRVR